MSKVYARFPKATKLCPSCYWVLIERVDDEGYYLCCPNEMCLSQEHYYGVEQIWERGSK